MARIWYLLWLAICILQTSHVSGCEMIKSPRTNKKHAAAAKDILLTGDYHGHMEHTAGQLTKGEYKVKLPDGRVQVSSDWLTAGRHTRL